MAFPTSYTKTTTAAATRNADAVVMTGTNFSDWFNATEGTLYIEGEVVDTGVSTTLLSINDGTVDNALNIYFDHSTGNLLFQVIDGGVEQAAVGGAVASSGYYKLACAFKAGDFAASLDGAAVATDAAGTIPTVDRLTIGALGTGVTMANSHIKVVQCYPRRLTNAQLIILST